MNRLSFGIKNSITETTAKYEQKLTEYRDMLEKCKTYIQAYSDKLEDYKTYIIRYSGKLEDYDKKSMDNQYSIERMSRDLAYLKEKSDKAEELFNDINTGQASKSNAQIDNLTATFVETNYKLEELDKNVVNRISDFMVELQKQSLFQNKQMQMELGASVNKLAKSYRSGKAMLWVLLILNLIGLSGVAFLILYVLEVIQF